jgi:hypothetical protein
MKWPIKIVRKLPDTEAGLKLQQIKDILYPPSKLDDVGEYKVQIEYGADYNLDAALTDLEQDANDEVTRKTIREVTDRLYKVRKILEAYVELHEGAQYMIVDNLQEEKDIKYDEHS